jgi:queuine tRNA-ribosyltransferase
MPVGTQGSVKAATAQSLEALGAAIVLGNTYHLFLRPGTAIVEKAGGLHRFMGWDGALLTDSGGYQVFSLAELRGVREEGVTFTSHIDGSRHLFTPDRVVDIQRSLGSDIMMVLDECAPWPCDEKEAERAFRLTERWAERCRARAAATEPLYGYGQALFGIVQGSVYPHLREASARTLVSMGFDGYAVGGLSVGEPAELMYRMTEICTAVLPRDRPRYLMGVGTPENILESIERGIDMFDCVLPTRNGRNALLFSRRGKLNLRNARFAADLRPVDEQCGCSTCRTVSRAYLRHLFKAGELLAYQLATIHNLYFYLRLCAGARSAILEDRFSSWKAATLRELDAGTLDPSD